MAQGFGLEGVARAAVFAPREWVVAVKSCRKAVLLRADALTQFMREGRPYGDGLVLGPVVVDDLKARWLDLGDNAASVQGPHLVDDALEILRLLQAIVL